MTEVHERAISEQKELEEKIEKLQSFITSKKFFSFSNEERFLLNSQHNAMFLYNEILKRRLEIWEDK